MADWTKNSERWAALVGVTLFLVLIGVPSIFHLGWGVRGSDWRRWGSWLAEKRAGEAVRLIDGDFERRFLLRFAAVALVESVPEVKGRVGVVGVRAGAHGFLFAEEDTEVCTAAGFLHVRFPKPRVAAEQIIAFDRMMKARGVHLVVVPVPAKATIYPDYLDAGYDRGRGPLVNVDQGGWFELLRSQGVEAVDVTGVLWAGRETGGDLFYPRDIHWTDRAKRLAAGEVAAKIKPWVEGVEPAKFKTRVVVRSVLGNLVEEEGAAAAPVAASTEEVVALSDEGGGAYLPGDGACVVLMGDSQAALDTEGGFGFAQRLTEALGVDVEARGVVGGGPRQMRMAVLEDAGVLEKKKVVVWVFSMRQLLIKEWEPLRVDR